MRSPELISSHQPAISQDLISEVTIINEAVSDLKNAFQRQTTLHRAINKENIKYQAKRLRLHLYKKTLWQMLNNTTYLVSGYFDQGILYFIDMCSEDLISIRNLPELYKRKPWHVLIPPKCNWWKLNNKKKARKGLKVLQDAIKRLEVNQMPGQ